jgi:hypothetical protein
MPELQFAIEGAEAVLYAAAPMLALKLRLTMPGADRAHASPLCAGRAGKAS